MSSSLPATIVICSTDPADERRLQMALVLLSRHLQSSGSQLPVGLRTAAVVHAPAATSRQESTDLDVLDEDGDGAAMQLMLDRTEVARRLDLSVRTVDRRIRAGDIPFCRFGRRVRVRTEDLANYVRSLPTAHPEVPKC